MLRHPQRTQPFPLTEQAWKTYLYDQSCYPEEVQKSHPSPNDMAVPLGQGHRPPDELLANCAPTGWTPPSDSMPAPYLETVCTLLAEYLKWL